MDRLDANRSAWNAAAYRAWIEAYGTPAEQAQVLKLDPGRKLRRLLPYLGDMNGAVVANPLGSHGRCAVAMSLLGAKVTVFDMSSANQRYAEELGLAASVNLSYVCTDFLAIRRDQYAGVFDLVAMELGITHWFTDIHAFAETAVSLAKRTGRVVLQDFHPATTKKGAYFDQELKTVPVPCAEILTAESLPSTTIRRWTVGEVVTAFAESGLRIDQLAEAPMHESSESAEIYTLVGTRFS